MWQSEAMRSLRFALPFAAASILSSTIALVGCSSKSTDATPTDVGIDAGPDTLVAVDASTAPPEWDRAVTPPSDDEAAKNRLGCVYKAGALPAETQGKSSPSGAKIPIDTVVVVMMENRSFDHYFQKLPTATGRTDLEVAPDTYTNPDVDAAHTPVKPFHDTQLCFVDTAHGWAASHQSWNGGKMDGFLAANENSDPAPKHGTPEMARGLRAMTYYEQADLPFMYWAAENYSIADHYHCSLLGPTWPNRMYLYAATSFGKTENKVPDAGKSMILFDELERRGIPWKVYGNGTIGFGILAAQFIKYREEHVFTLEDYKADAAAGTLPNVAFVDPNLGSEAYNQNDEHPPAMMQGGQAFVADVTKTLMASPQWKRSALFLTYDEHGGLWDHVAPPAACPPDDTPPQLPAGDPPGAFDRYGVRVPLVVISPWAKKRYVGHHTYDHTSIVRFIQARFVLPAMTNRDANAEAPWDLFDFGAARTDTPAVPTVPIAEDKLAKCKAIFE